MANRKQTYQYKKDNSILANQEDEYKLSVKEYYRLYNFFVTYSCCGNQSMKKRELVDYGWDGYATKPDEQMTDEKHYLKDAVLSIIDLSDKSHFIFTDEDNLRECYEKLALTDGILPEFDTERGVISRTNESNQFLKLCYRIRDGFAHGKFLLKLNSNNEKMIIIQDDDSKNVTARIVIKLDTLIRIITIVDKNNLI